MENASKALIMAGSVLIALMIIGALLLMFNNLSNYQDTNVKNDRDAQVVEFNNQYETYIRNDVRGSDLYSLLNKVIDYNKRKSDVATGTDEGTELQFQAMSISFNFKSETNRKKLTYDNKIRIFTKNNYELTDETTNSIEDMIKESINKIENRHGKSGLTNLTTGISNLFDKTSSQDQQKAIELWNRNSKKTVSDYNDLERYKDDIYTYYEYMQFKRAYFDSTNVEYNKKTGRIVKMEFEFNGNIE